MSMDHSKTQKKGSFPRLSLPKGGKTQRSLHCRIISLSKVKWLSQGGTGVLSSDPSKTGFPASGIKIKEASFGLQRKVITQHTLP